MKLVDFKGLGRSAGARPGAAFLHRAMALFCDSQGGRFIV
jgi:hypothetical protein